VRLRPNAQLTLLEEIKRVLHISEGDEVEFSVHDDETMTVRGYVSIPTDQAWFLAPEWLAGEREADQEIAGGRGTAHESPRTCSPTWTRSALRMPGCRLVDGAHNKGGCSVSRRPMRASSPGRDGARS
jgi:hypothetical protein